MNSALPSFTTRPSFQRPKNNECIYYENLWQMKEKEGKKARGVLDTHAK